MLSHIPLIPSLPAHKEESVCRLYIRFLKLEVVKELA